VYVCVCVYVCMYVCMYGCMDVRLSVCMHVLYVCNNVCTYVTFCMCLYWQKPMLTIRFRMETKSRLTYEQRDFLTHLLLQLSPEMVLYCVMCWLSYTSPYADRALYFFLNPSRMSRQNFDGFWFLEKKWETTETWLKQPFECASFPNSCVGDNLCTVQVWDDLAYRRCIGGQQNLQMRELC